MQIGDAIRVEGVRGVVYDRSSFVDENGKPEWFSVTVGPKGEEVRFGSFDIDGKPRWELTNHASV